MRQPDTTPPRTHRLTEAHKAYDPRILIFYPLVGALLLAIAIGFAYQQLFKTDIYHESEKLQSQRRILYPAPRGNIYDREGRELVINRPRYSVALNLDELRREFRREYLQLRKYYRELDDKNIPPSAQLWITARQTVVQRYLDQVNLAIERDERVDPASLNRHYNQQLLLPYTLLDDLTSTEYARIAEQVPVTSPIQLNATSVRYYPYGSAAMHTLGYISQTDKLEIENFPGDELTTFRMRGTEGMAGLERSFNKHLQGKAGGAIYRVDPAGYRIDPPLMRVLPVQGQNLHTSLDIDLQLVAEQAMGSVEQGALRGAAVAIDVRTGEVLALASNPHLDLNDFSPRMSQATVDKLNELRAWDNLALNALYEPGSTFKILDTIAGFRSGKLKPDSVFYCGGRFELGSRFFDCHDRYTHGDIDLHTAISKSCNIFFYNAGLVVGPQALAAEARRFGLDKPSGIELPAETSRMLIPDPAYKKREKGENWLPSDTIMMAIGQSFTVVTPLDMACFMASVARDETRTRPTLLHDPTRARLQTEPIGLPHAQRAALIEAMRDTVKKGTGKLLVNPRSLTGNLSHLDIAGKTGTAQKEVWEKGKKGIINYAWFIGFAPAADPRIAVVVALEGDVPGEEAGGGAKAAPIAGYIFKKYFEKHPGEIPPAPAPAVAEAPLARR